MVQNHFIYTSKNWEQSKCPSTGEWVNKWWYIHVEAYCLGIKRTEVWIHTATRFSLRIIMLSKQKQTKKKDGVFRFTWNLHASVVTEIRSVLPGASGAVVAKEGMSEHWGGWVYTWSLLWLWLHGYICLSDCTRLHTLCCTYVLYMYVYVCVQYNGIHALLFIG